MTTEEAESRVALIAEQVTRLAAASASHAARDIAEEIIGATTPKRLRAIVTAVDQLCAASSMLRVGVKRVTFRAFAERWTSGALAREYPDQVKSKKTSSDDVERLRKYVYPHIGNIPIESVSLEHVLLVMSRISSDASPATRRHIAQVMIRVLALAVFPARLIKVSPVPRGFLPKLPKRKAFGYLYPDEDARLLACKAVPLPYRILYGVLAREGMRVSEAIGNAKREIGALAWAELDLERGIIRLDENKTDDPRAWALNPGVVETLKLLKQTQTGDLPFADIVHRHLADQFRAHLKMAGVDREELFERGLARQPIRVHDLRATFVTLSLAHGKTETWVMDRTGHTTSLMLAKYRRLARTFEELRIGELQALNKTIPEVATWAAGGQQSKETT